MHYNASSFRRPLITTNKSYGTVPLTDDQLRKLAPSVFAETAHESRSARYAYIPTSEVVRGLRDAGFVPMTATQGKSRVEGKAEFTKHLIRFRHADHMTGKHLKLGGVIPEVALINSHDGTSAYKVVAGMMRLVCLNGMLVADEEFGSIRVGHTGNIRDQVIDATFTVLDQAKLAIETAGNWSGVTMSRPEQMLLAEQAHIMRFADAEGVVKTPIMPVALLAPRRHEDAGADLWSVTSRIQENVMRGGLEGVTKGTKEKPSRRVSTRPIKGIDADVKLNRALWALSERMAELKAG